MVSDAMKATVRQELLEIEQEENVCIFYACESGSCAWGFPSADSDYDVRFIYIHPRDWYLSIEERRDVIERPLMENIDLSGWEIRKALRLFRKSNPPLLEWLRSSIVYQQRFSMADSLRDLIPVNYSPRNCFHHYLHMAEGNFREYLRGETVRVKKYFYVLRPLLGCRWIEAGLWPSASGIWHFGGKGRYHRNFEQEIFSLLKRKQSGQELDFEPRIPVISNFIENELDRLKKKADQQPLSPSHDDNLDKFFRAALIEVWK